MRFRMHSIINVKDLVKQFACLRILNGITFEVDKGGVAVFIGPSGSGKTTLLRCINFLEEYDSGEVIIDGKLIGKTKSSNGLYRRASEREIARSRMEIGMVFQQFNLFPHLSALENVIISPIEVKGLPRKDAKEVGEELLHKVGLSDKMNEYPGRLSGGQQQRVAIARALAMRPKVMLFDEVTSALDPGLVDEVFQVIGQLANEGMTMAIVTHEISFAMDIASDIYFLDGGIIREKGPPKEVLMNPKDEKLKVFLKRFSSGFQHRER